MLGSPQGTVFGLVQIQLWGLRLRTKDQTEADMEIEKDNEAAADAAGAEVGDVVVEAE